MACKLYAMRNEGKFPDQLSDLVPTYFHDTQDLTFPTGDGRRRLDVEYFGGSDTDPADAALLRVAAERPGGAQVIVHTDTSGTLVPESKSR